MFAGKLSCETAFPFKSPTTRFEGERGKGRERGKGESGGGKLNKNRGNCTRTLT
jgi:hypothetical protein